jgi:hypothetical protein
VLNVPTAPSIKHSLSPPLMNGRYVSRFRLADLISMATVGGASALSRAAVNAPCSDRSCVGILGAPHESTNASDHPATLPTYRAPRAVAVAAARNGSTRATASVAVRIAESLHQAPR